MYKAFNSKKYRLAFETFGKRAKEVSIVYKLGIRNFESDDSKNYSIVIGNHRIIFSINKPQMGGCQG